jgi:hypothetical protein
VDRPQQRAHPESEEGKQDEGRVGHGADCTLQSEATQGICKSH